MGSVWHILQVTGFVGDRVNGVESLTCFLVFQVVCNSLAIWSVVVMILLVVGSECSSVIT